MKPFRAFAPMLLTRTWVPRWLGGRPSEDAEVVLDLSRLLSRSYHVTPTGIDRVEFVYARELLDRIPDRLAFAAVHPAGGYYGRLPVGAVRQFLSFTDARWQNPDAFDPQAVRAAANRHLLALRPRPVPTADRRRIYLQASHHHLDDIDLVAAILKRERARLIALIHDVIPLTHPEFARSDGQARHGRVMRTIDRHASGIIGNSAATIAAVGAHLTDARSDRVIRVAHLGTDPAELPSTSRSTILPASPEAPYFVCVATIEPRKNHLLLLNVWRRLVETLGSAAPKLVLIGRRGWENENAIDMIERCTALSRHVIEASDMSDRVMQAILGGAQALLLPSFAEGFGMPVSEALAAGVPVICSDIAALREVGGETPDYLDPLDGLGWLEAVIAYSRPGSPRRAAQLDRMAQWRPVSWAEHIDVVEATIDSVGAMARA